MMKALTEFLAAGPKTEQPKMTSQEPESSAQKFANTMDELLISATTESYNAAAYDNNTENLGEAEQTQPLIDDLSIGTMEPAKNAPNTTNESGLISIGSGSFVLEVEIDESSISSVNLEQVPDATTTLTGTASSLDGSADQGVKTLQGNASPVGSEESAELTMSSSNAALSASPAKSGLTNTAASASIPMEITLNMVEAGRKFAGHLSETPNNTMTVTSTAASISSAKKAAVAIPEVVGADNSLTSTEGIVRNAKLLGVAERLPSSQSPERPSVDPRLEAATDRAAAASSAAVAKVDLNARQTASFDTGIKSSNTEQQQFAGEMATHIRVLKSQSGGEVKLNLHPAELGRMSISVSTEGNETRVAFVVETSQARQAVETALPRLRDMLENAGLSLSDSDVSEQRDSRAGANERGSGGSSGETATPDSNDISATTVVSVKVDPDRLIDTYI